MTVADTLIEDTLQNGGTISEGFASILYHYYSGQAPGVLNRPLGPDDLQDCFHWYPNGQDLDLLLGTDDADAVRAARTRRRA